MIPDRPIDPLFQQKYYFAVFDKRGHVIGTVYVLNTAMKPRREGDGRKHDSIRRIRGTRSAGPA
ncbi:hypothetical protein [Paenibacillus sp. FSL L8-0709]|uniref:hypothetical protein n=1 Tax=Paenibacillus sp. FSL L8-0709 TaxID=2975312 RepID=UPI0030FA1E3B